jgi:hypothetical protein
LEARGVIVPNYMASIMDEDTDGLVEVDLRTLPTPRLADLLAEACENYDLELVVTIAGVIKSRDGGSSYD